MSAQVSQLACWRAINGGAIDQVLARFTDIIFAFPGLLFIILVSGIWGEWADTALSNIPIIGANGNARLLVVSIALAFRGMATDGPLRAWPDTPAQRATIY